MKTVNWIRARNPISYVFVKNIPKKRPLSSVLLAKPNAFALNVSLKATMGTRVTKLKTFSKTKSLPSSFYPILASKSLK